MANSDKPSPSRHPSKLVTIFCDGSSLGNGGDEARAASVALLGYQGLWRAFGLYLGKATNQQGALKTIAHGSFSRLKLWLRRSASRL